MTFERTKSTAKWLGNKGKDYVLYSTAYTAGIMIVAGPIQAVIDTACLEGISQTCQALGWNNITLDAMTDETSVQQKLKVTLYMGLAGSNAYGWLREKSRKFFGATQKAKEKIQALHDFVYTAAFSSTINGYAYLSADEKNYWNIGVSLGLLVASQTVRGPLIGYACDVYKDFLGLKECVRTTYPKKIKNLGRKAKLGVGAAAIGATVGLMGLYYEYVTLDSWSEPKPNQTQVEQVENINLEKIVKEN